MNYIELINNFWQLDEEYSFNGNETRLFFFLVKKCNSLRWKNPFSNSDGHTALAVGISVNTLKSVRNRLKQAGLIDFRPGGNGAHSKGVYTIKVSDFDTLEDDKVSDKVSKKVSGKVSNSDTISKHKQKHKQEVEEINKEEKVINNPFSEKFLTEWERWKAYKKSQHKDTYKSTDTEQTAINHLFQLSGGDEQKAIALNNYAIAKTWKGHYPIKNEVNGTHQQVLTNGNKGTATGLLNYARDRFNALRDENSGN